MSGVQIYLGNGDGTFHAGGGSGISIGAPSGQVVAADVNGDGKLDVVVANSTPSSPLFPTAGNVTVLLGKGDGTLQPGVTYNIGMKATSVAIGDLNGDGKPDLAAVDYGTGKLAVLMGNGDGTFQTPVSYAAIQGANSVLMGDFNGDGNQDVAIASSGSTTTGADGFVMLMLAMGMGRFAMLSPTARDRMRRLLRQAT